MLLSDPGKISSTFDWRLHRLMLYLPIILGDFQPVVAAHWNPRYDVVRLPSGNIFEYVTQELRRLKEAICIGLQMLRLFNFGPDCGYHCGH